MFFIDGSSKKAFFCTFYKRSILGSLKGSFPVEIGEETVQTTLAEMRDRAPMAPTTQVWWPALGQEEGDSGELRWTTHGEAEAELGLTLPANHALAGAELQVQVIPTPAHFLRPYLAHFPPRFFPLFCAFSPSRRDGSNEPQAGTQGQETVARGSEQPFLRSG